MNLYRVYNGYTGFVDVSCLVTAPTKDIALTLAEQSYKETREYRKNKDYAAHLKADLIFENCNEMHCTEPEDL
jgi:hypothetical protein